MFFNTAIKKKKKKPVAIALRRRVITYTHTLLYVRGEFGYYKTCVPPKCINYYRTYATRNTCSDEKPIPSVYYYYYYLYEGSLLPVSDECK